MKYQKSLKDTPQQVLLTITSKRSKKADVVFILNKDGYAGYSTSMEIGYAVALGKPIIAMVEDPEYARDVLYDGYAKDAGELIPYLK